ncbi:MAG TPA: AAA family ATPase [Acidimicrobiia bacterium]|nr:AAA family ATPase [Acidimicrobiia bacterium]
MPDRTGAAQSSMAAVLFTDLVESTALMARVGDASFDELRGEHMTRLARAVERHGGTVVKNTGDGVMATFASSVDALAAAVAAQQATAAQVAPGGVPFTIRVGLATGEVAIEDGDVFGTPVVEAARLVAAAQPSQILCTALVRAMAGSRAPGSFTDLGPIELKGLPDAVPVCEVAWTPAREGPPVPFPTLVSHTGRVFVGRDDEMARLRMLWKEAQAGERRLVLLGGEPGAGKTRLAAALAQGLHSEGALVLAGRCDEDLGVPFQPFVEALRHYVTHATFPRLGRHAGELARLVPELGQLVPDLPAPLQADPETERYRLFDAVAAWLAEASTEAPVLLLLDDLHWAAKPTVLLLRHVLRAPEASRLLMVATYRDSDIGRGDPLTELLADLPRTEGASRFPVTGLDAQGVAALLESAAGHGLDEAGEELARSVWRETEGNALFVIETLRHLREAGALEWRDDRWVVTPALEQLGVPEGVRDVVGRRLSRLSDETNAVLACASVVGLDFDPAIVQAAGGFSEDELLHALEQAVAARLLVDIPGPTPRNAFSHALIRATLYDELTGARRVALHRRVAQAIETLFADRLDDHLPALSHHWSRAAAPAPDATRAAEYAVRAGDRALAQLAHDEAVTYYRSALELLEAATEAAGPERTELLISLGEAQRRAGDAAYRETLFAAARLAQEAGDADRLARAALANHRGVWSAAGAVDEDRVGVLEAAIGALDREADSTLRARLLAQLGIELTFSPDPARKQELCREALEIARRDGSPRIRGEVIVAVTEAIRNADTVDERLSLTVELLEVAHTAGNPVLAFWGNVYRAIAASEVFDAAETSRCTAAALRLADELRQPSFGWMSRLIASVIALTTGRFQEGEQLSLESYRLGQSTGQTDAATYFGVNTFTLAFHQGRLAEVTAALAEAQAAAPSLLTLQAYAAVAYCETQREAEARALFEGLVPRLPELPKELTWLRFVAQLATICARLGDTGRASILHGLLAPHSEQAASSGGTWFGAVAHHLGLLATTLGRFDEADQRFARAEELHEKFGAVPWTARTRLEWAEMLVRRNGPGDAERARGLLAQALDAAADLGLGTIDRRGRALLDAIS